MERKHVEQQDAKTTVGGGRTVLAFTMALAMLALAACGGEDPSGSAGNAENVENADNENVESMGNAGAGTDSGTDLPEDSSAAGRPGGTYGGEEDFERLTTGAELPRIYAEYLEILEQIRTEGRDPNGREYQSDDSRNFQNNGFAILDVDDDGRQELVFNFNESYLGAMCEVVYEYDVETDTLREELVEWVSTEYYGNGLVKAEMSHNHGKDPETRGIWPYMVYRYDEEQDIYRLLYTVDGWDGQINGEGFPDELDADGDKLLYCVTVESESEETLYFDREAYESWSEELLPEWSRIHVTYHSMTEAAMDSIRSAYRQAAAYAAQADVWFVGEEAGSATGEYLLYDLDGDGSLELTTSVMQGTGRYSYNSFYGLTDRGKVTELELVRLCGSKERDWNADFDIGGRTSIQAYQDGNDIIYYEGNDYVREGIYGGYDESGFYYLKGGTVYQDSIRRRTEFFGNGGGHQEEEIHYYGMEEEEDKLISDEEITRERYEAIREEYVRDMTEIRVYQNWEYFTWEEITKGDITEEAICLKLFDSFLGSE